MTFEGQELPAGKYSVWTEPGPEKWVVIFNKQANAFHTRYPPGQDALRLEVTPRTASHMETLTFYFPAVDGHKGERPCTGARRSCRLGSRCRRL